MSGQDDFIEAIEAFAQAVRRARGAPDRAGGGLSLSQYALLEPLAERDDVRVGDLAGCAGITPPTATRILDALERRGVVRRARSEEDRRAVAVSLTAAGRELLAEQTAWRHEREAVFYATLPAAERAIAPDLMRRMAGLVDELAQGMGGTQVPGS
jgi:DNA-binding MarR family transcriptional regulator